MPFDIIASTGRTATTYLAAALDRLDGIAATHEGYRGSNKDATPLFPLVNLENSAAYASADVARKTVAELRSAGTIASALDSSGADHLIDVAYYNAMIGSEILTQHPHTRMIGIIRECEEFVRSATTLEGEDLLPIGWPAPDKPLTDREKFISLGRIRPRRGSPVKGEWDSWGAIRRNIWLWEETNLRLCSAKEQFGDRVALLRFSAFQSDPDEFLAFCARFLTLPYDAYSPLTAPKKMINKKPSGYQIGTADTWNPSDLAALEQAQNLIEKTAYYEL
jgi:5-methylcytosine-specific restriction endonuclease McrA